MFAISYLHKFFNTSIVSYSHDISDAFSVTYSHDVKHVVVAKYLEGMVQYHMQTCSRKICGKRTIECLHDARVVVKRNLL